MNSSETVEEAITNEVPIERDSNPVQMFVDNMLYIRSALNPFQQRANIMETEEREVA